MRFIFKSIRWVLGQIVIFIDWVTRPKIPVHTASQQADLDAQTRKLALYQFQQCPFCVRTRRTIRRLGLDIELRDTRNNEQWKQELISEGGKYQVPCLRITRDDGTVEWMYESADIDEYLDARFGNPG